MSLLPAPRAYLLTDGMVTLSPQGSEPDESVLVVNTLTRGTRTVTFADFRGLVDAATGSPEAYDAMWDALARQVAALLAAAVPAVRAVRPRPGAPGGVELLGVDVLLDQGLQPWVIEVRWPPLRYRAVQGGYGTGRPARPAPGGRPLSGGHEGAPQAQAQGEPLRARRLGPGPQKALMSAMPAGR